MTLGTGGPAPDFELRDQHGATHALSSYRGRKVVVVMFYPFAFSRVCTGELLAVGDGLPALHDDDVELLAVSCDPVFSLRALSDRDDVRFPLLSDFWPHGEVARAYDSFDPVRGCAERSTFVVDRSGVLRWSVANAMADARDPEELVRAVRHVS